MSTFKLYSNNQSFIDENEIVKIEPFVFRNNYYNTLSLELDELDDSVEIYSNW